MSPDTKSQILLVEDNPDDLEMTLFQLKKMNLAHCVEIARDGVEALDYLFCRGPHACRDIANVPNVVLLDLKLPMVDGLDVLRAIKGDDRTRMIPVVVLTSSQEQSDVVESYHLGVNSYIVKPVDFAQFGQTVKKLGMYWLLLNHPPSP